MSMIPGEDERSEKLLRMEKHLETVLKQGPCFENGKIRIFAAWHYFDRLQLIEFVREEYGIGGFANDTAWADFEYVGIRVRRPEPECQYSWSQVVSKIGQLIHRCEYLDEREQRELNRIIGEYGYIPPPVARIQYPKQ